MYNKLDQLILFILALLLSAIMFIGEYAHKLEVWWEKKVDKFFKKEESNE